MRVFAKEYTAPAKNGFSAGRCQGTSHATDSSATPINSVRRRNWKRQRLRFGGSLMTALSTPAGSRSKAAWSLHRRRLHRGPNHSRGRMREALTFDRFSVQFTCR